MTERIYKKLDFSSLDFPSDSLTIRTIRSKHASELFDKGFVSEQPQFFLQPELTGHSEDAIGGMMYVERLVAAFAYAESAGIDPPQSCQVSISDLEGDLVNNYVFYGLASGPKHAAELIRSIRRQGHALAGERRR